VNWLLAAWILYISFFVIQYRRLTATRRAEGGAVSSGHDKTGQRAALLQGMSILLANISPVPERTTLRWIAMPLVAFAILFTLYSMQHLGRHWRIHATITADHQLITTGPYAIVRHPIYLALLCMIAGSALSRSSPPAGIAALLIYLYATELRVRTEDALLRKHFPAAQEYQQNVKAYLPGIR
jgi:protein-S-isoprenylcysteine O-methyltransferase Ste14